MIERLRPQSRATSSPANDSSSSDMPVSTPKDTKTSSTQPTRKLPTDRIAFQKQLDILRAYGALSQGGTRAVPVKEVAEMVGMSATTVPLMNTFMLDNDFVQKSGTDFVPHRALIEFAQAHSWNAETATRKLGSLIRQTWFGNRLHSRLSYSAMQSEQAVHDLAAQISASPSCKAQIELLIDYAAKSGLVRRDGSALSLGEEAGSQPMEQPVTEKLAPEPETKSDPLPRPQQGSVATGFMSAEGGVQFSVLIKVDMKEMAGWTPDRIAAFFSGLAQVLAAKKGTESVND